MTERRYFHWLTYWDRIAARIVVTQSGVEEFSVQFECRVGDSDEWAPIRRYDNSHNVCHVHVYSKAAEPRRTELIGHDNKSSLKLAFDQIDLHWERFKRTYEEG